jgi:NAD-dependent dihydropyrimidine dehydrogenase PreA subunit
MALFIAIEVDPKVAHDAAVVKKMVEACPVDIYDANADGSLAIVDENLDECTLCDLCIQAAPPGSVRIRKLYEEG